MATATSALALAVAVWQPSIADAAARGSSSPSYGHLYVLDDWQKAVYRYPLAQDGLPAINPDGILYPQGAKFLEGLTVDKVGHVFLADPDQGTVSEFAAGATGQQYPISTLNVGNAPDRLKIDDGDRLYVHLNGNETIAIFAKGAHGNDAPIRIIPTYGWSIDYVVARSGALYVLENNFAVAVYDNPFQSSSQPNRLIKPDGGFFEFNSTLALDEATDRLYYIQFGPDGQYWDKVNYDVRPPSPTSVPSVQKPWIFTGDCGSGNYVNVGGTEIIKNYFIVSCLNNSDVLVYRTGRFGRQKAPVETIGQGSLQSPWEIAVGP